ncbi:MAG: histidinol dehydrogenase [Bacteroidetes bacterium]|nr:histidinol dehydrogenase [Bacteroidota bacterium]
MKFIDNPDRTQWRVLVTRPVQPHASLDESILGILDAVRKEGDAALIKYSLRFDGQKVESLSVSREFVEAAINTLDPALRQAIETAATNIRTFHSAQARGVERVETMQGVVCWRRYIPIERVGIYIPGGSAPLFSTVLMLGIPAQLAGCKEIHLCTPPGKDGSIHPAILFAADYCGITQIHPVGGAQAIAAMAYGTASVPAVSKIFGPGNQYVTRAKQLIAQQGTAIDMPAGPSEVLVYGDDTCVPAFAAADLLSQAEHGPDSQVVMVSRDLKILKAVSKEIEKQLSTLPRAEVASQALKNSMMIHIENEETILDFINDYAPEHLILQIKDPESIAGKITNAGSVFIGPWTPEAVGDYASGTNHTLPTNGFAKSYSGISLDSFTKGITFQSLTEEGLRNIASVVETLAKAEQLEAHRRAVQIRLDKLS